MEEEPGSSSLILALGGFSIEAETEQSELQGALVAQKAMAAAALARPGRQVAAGTGALVSHAHTIAGRVLEHWQDTSAEELQQESEALASLCFALQAALGPTTRLADSEERQLFEAATTLWGASLQALSAGGAGAEAASGALDRMGSDLFALVDGDSDATQECTRYVSYFSAAARSWTVAGQRDKARWCIERAMRYSQQLEALVASEGVGAERKEGLVVALFSLYLEGAKSAADSKQQALANNLLTRAMQLSRHAAVGPDAAACCAVAVAELQLQQARQMLAEGGAMCGLAAALLSSAVQQLSSAHLQRAVAAGGCHADGLLAVKKQVLALLVQAHLASGEAGLASKVLDALESEVPGAAATDPALQMMFVEAKLAAGRVPEALRFLMVLMQPTDPTADPVAASATAATFLAGLRLALSHIMADTLPSFQSAISAFVWKATAATPPTPLLQLVQALLAEEKGSELCQRLVLQVLSAEDVSASLHRDAGVLCEVHSLLFHRAAHCLEAGSCAAAKDLFSAALQFAGAGARAKNARALAACHSRLGMYQRAAEYLAIAARHEQQPSSLTQLARLQALAQAGDMVQALATIRSITSCLDFHPSLIAAMCQAAANAQHPAVYKEALSTATQVLIKPEAASSTVPAGQEAALLLGLVQIIDACFKAAPPPAGAGADAAPGGGVTALYGELVAAVKLVTKRLKLLGWERFVGADKAGSTMQAICRMAYNRLLAAQQCSAHEHVVTLATALFQLLPLVDQRLQADVTGAAQQAKILMIATQALLDLHSKQPESGQKLALAVRLQSRLAQHMPALAMEQHLHLHLLHYTMGLETAARQGDGAALLQCIDKLQPHAGKLSAPQHAGILDTIGTQHSSVVQEAAARLLLDSIAANGTLPSLSLVPTLLCQLSLSAEVQLHAISRCQQLLAAMPPLSRSTDWTQCAQWLAVHAWNAGSRLVQSAGANELLHVAVQLQGACSPAGNEQLRRMKAALEAAGLNHGFVPANGQAAAQQDSGVATGTEAAKELGGVDGLEVAGMTADPLQDSPAAASSGGEEAVQPAPDLMPADGAISGPAAGTVSSSPATCWEPSNQAAAALAPAAVPTAPAVQAVPASPAVDGGDSSSEDSVCEGAMASVGGWLDSMLAAHKRVLGNANGNCGPPKRRAVQGPLGCKPAPPASGTGQLARKQHQAPPEATDADGADALSLGDSMPFGDGFMGL